MKYQFESTLVMEKVGLNTDARFPCAVCGKSYLRKRHLQRHMRDECIGIPPRFSCDFCPSRFRRKYHMVRHLTSKHNIQPAIAQQAGGGGARNTTNIASQNNNNSKNNNNNGLNLSMLTLKRKNSEASSSECAIDESAIPENLSLRKEQYENGSVGVAAGGNNVVGNGNMSASPTYSGGACSSSGTQSPLSLHLPLPTYGLTGAITAISSAAAAAAAAAAALASEQHAGAMKLTTKRKRSNVNNDSMSVELAQPNANGTAILDGNDDGCGIGVTDVVGGVVIKTEPISPSRASVAAAAAAAVSSTDDDVANVVGKMEDDWKMKLSLQLISNSLLKERLMNTIPFGTGYNNN